MAINFACPHCGSAQNADERYAGMTGPCTSCGQQITVPHNAFGSPATKAGAGAAVAAGAGVGGVLIVVGVISLVVLVACGGILVALLLPAVQAARQASQRMASLNNEKQIMLALHNYHDAYGVFPPAYIADANGKPMHSWRVLILPYVEQAGLHSRYDFSKPWDSPENMAVAQMCPPVYRSPLDPNTNTNQTSYLLIGGKGTLFADGQAAKLTQIPDGTSNTLALVEVDNSGVVWTQPTDLDAAELDFVIRNLQDAQPRQINSAVKGGTVGGFFDGSVRFIPSTTPPADLRSAVDPADARTVYIGQ